VDRFAGFERSVFIGLDSEPPCDLADSEAPSPAILAMEPSPTTSIPYSAEAERSYTAAVRYAQAHHLPKPPPLQFADGRFLMVGCP
jgi:hypothetical protein